MQQGKLLPSTTIMALLKKSMANSPGHYVALDGFPRSRENCEDFQAMCGAPECAIHIEVPDDVMIERILKRGRESGRADDNIATVSFGPHFVLCVLCLAIVLHIAFQTPIFASVFSFFLLLLSPRSFLHIYVLRSIYFEPAYVS